MTVNGGTENGKSASGANDEQDDKVSYETYKKVLDQRKADRDKARELQEQLDAVKAERESAEAARLAEQKRYEELYNAEKSKVEKLSGQIKEMTTQQVERAKKSALKEALGVSKEEYLKFADLDAIQLLEDGTPDPETLKSAANKFRETYPELIPAKSGSKIPNDAAKDGGLPKPKDPMQMSQEELRVALRETLSKK
jgi:type II secretory pathway pseudopilin PulG